MTMINSLKALLHKEFRMTDLCHIRKFLGVDFACTSQGMLLHQTQYAHQILQEVRMEESHPTYIPMQEGLQLKKEDEFTTMRSKPLPRPSGTNCTGSRKQHLTLH